MKLFKCKFAKDINGIYIFPLVGYSNVNGLKSLWLGWLFWLWTIQFN